MGAFHGNLTYSLYFVLDEPEAGFRERFIESLRTHAFRDVDVEAGKDRSLGWTVMGDPFDVDLTWERVFFDPYVVVSLREDTIKVPPNALKAHLQKRERELLKASGKERLDKGERTALKADVLDQLRRRALPDIRSYDVVWHTVEGTLRLWSTNKRLKELFEDHVEKTWGLRIVPAAPYTYVMRRAKADEEAAMLGLDPADFTGASGGDA